MGFRTCILPAMARPHKGQHKIPRTYLEAFTDLKGSVWIANEEFKIFSQKPKDVLKEHDYYTIRFSSGGGTLDIETKYLGGIEGNYADLYREKIEKRRQTNKEEKAKLAIFVASMMERQPIRRESLKKFFKDVEKITVHMRGLPEKAKKAMASLPTTSTSESIPADELLKMGKDVGSLHSSLIPETVVETAPIIFDMKWAFRVRPEDSDPFITSDNPCVMVNPELEAKIGRGKIGSQPGLLQKGVEITLPLSSDVALICGWQVKEDCAYVPTSVEKVEEVNRRTRRHARNVVGSDKEMLQQIIDRLKAVSG